MSRPLLPARCLRGRRVLSAASIGRVLSIAASLWAAGATADIADALTTARAQGCAGRPGPGVSLNRSARLDAAARALERQDDLGGALQSAEYRAERSTAITVQGANDEAALGRAVIERNCLTLLDPGLREFGLHLRTGAAWIVLAAPFEAPGADDAQRLSEQVRALVNEARRSARTCGSREFAAAPPLTRNPLLERAAAQHAEHMARLDFMAHTGRDGSQPRDRVTRTGYRWRAVGENIAGGPTAPRAVVDGWLKSPGHCANIMSGAFTEIGVAFAVNRQSRFGIYWAQVFGAPR